LQIYPRTLQEHGTSLNSVPCAYFRVSLRDCAIHSSRWVDFTDFGLVGLRFFVRSVSFVAETTARLRCALVFVKSVCVDMLFAPCAIMRDHKRRSKDIFRPHTEACAC
jgi:hypothetical protein